MEKKFLLLFLINFSSHAQINTKVVKAVKREVVKKARPSTSVAREIFDVNLEEKSKQTEKLISDASEYFKANSLVTSCNSFLRDNRWKIAELFVIVLDYDGTCLCHGDETDLIWKDFKNYKNVAGYPIIEELRAKGDAGGWITYQWNNGYKWAYAKIVTKDKKKYILTSGFFPESQEFTTRQLVLSAVNEFNNHGLKAAFSSISNPVGAYIKGDIYLFAYDFDGNVVAHGENVALVGQNLYDLKDSAGTYLIRELIRVAKSPEGSGWVDYLWKGMPKRSYVQKVEDPKTNKPYLIAGGYYPTIDEETVIDFVRKGISYLKANGKDVAFRDFSNKIGDFAKGGLTIFAYDLEGNNLADGDNPSFVGQNLLRRKDAEGKEVTKLIIEQAQKYGKGWVTFMEQNAYQDAYVEKIEIQDGAFILGAGFYPSSKQQSVKSLAEKAVIQLKASPYNEAFRQFSKRDGDFIRGDVNVFVYDTEGNCFVNGSRHSVIWNNFINAKDDTGASIIDTVIATGRSGGAWVSYKIQNGTRRVYVKGLEREFDGKPKTFIVGSGYFL